MGMGCSAMRETQEGRLKTRYDLCIDWRIKLNLVLWTECGGMNWIELPQDSVQC
jgi:hypothetical protein